VEGVDGYMCPHPLSLQLIRRKWPAAFARCGGFKNAHRGASLRPNTNAHESRRPLATIITGLSARGTPVMNFITGATLTPIWAFAGGRGITNYEQSRMPRDAPWRCSRQA